MKPQNGARCGTLLRLLQSSRRSDSRIRRPAARTASKQGNWNIGHGYPSYAAGNKKQTENLSGCFFARVIGLINADIQTHRFAAQRFARVAEMGGFVGGEGVGEISAESVGIGGAAVAVQAGGDVRLGSGSR